MCVEDGPEGGEVRVAGGEEEVLGHLDDDFVGEDLLGGLRIGGELATVEPGVEEVVLGPEGAVPDLVDQQALDPEVGDVLLQMLRHFPRHQGAVLPPQLLLLDGL